MPQVSDVIRDRMPEADGFQRMVVVSGLAHLGFIALLALMPEGLLSRHEVPKTVMTISLGGGTGGPENGGLTPISSRSIQVETPLPPSRRPEPIRPPAAKTPEMVLPSGKAPSKTQTAPVKQAPADAHGRTPTKGAQASAGQAVADTGARGQGFGLSTGGAGSGSRLDVADFCCPEYIVTMIERIRANWKSQAEVPGEAIIKFTIQRDGTMTGIEVEKSSGYSALDINAQRAMVGTRRLPELPAAFPNPTLTVHLNFQYSR